MDIADSALISSGLRLVGDATVTVGDGAFLNHDCLLEAADAISVAGNVALGYRTKLLTSAHDFSDPECRAGPWRTAPIVIERGAWLGADVVVMPGVTIGAGAVVGAGSVVTRDCEPHSVYVGSPARKIKDLNTTKATCPTPEQLRPRSTGTDAVSSSGRVGPTPAPEERTGRAPAARKGLRAFRPPTGKAS
jgi:maltose O-acetyltransferase